MKTEKTPTFVPGKRLVPAALSIPQVQIKMRCELNAKRRHLEQLTTLIEDNELAAILLKDLIENCMLELAECGRVYKETMVLLT